MENGRRAGAILAMPKGNPCTNGLACPRTPGVGVQGTSLSLSLSGKRERERERERERTRERSLKTLRERAREKEQERKRERARERTMDRSTRIEREKVEEEQDSGGERLVYKFPAEILLGASELISRNKLGNNRGIDKTKQNQKFCRPKAAPKQNGENNGKKIKSSKPSNFVQ